MFFVGHLTVIDEGLHQGVHRYHLCAHHVVKKQWWKLQIIWRVSARHII